MLEVVDKDGRVREGLCQSLTTALGNGRVRKVPEVQQSLPDRVTHRSLFVLQGEHTTELTWKAAERLMKK